MTEKALRWVLEAANHIGKQFWEIRAAADEPKVGELLIYGPIWGEAFFDDEVAPGKIRKQLEALGDIDTIKVFVNSPGGSPFAGAAIYNILRRHPAQVHMYVDGLAASAASVIVMAGDKVIMPANSMLMIHDAWTIGMGNKRELRKTADTLEQIDESIIASYKEKTGLSRRRIVDLMAAETWMTAKEAKELGFADEVEDSNKVAASIDRGFLVVNDQRVDLSLFESRPSWLQTADPPIAAIDPSPEPEPNNPPTGERRVTLSHYERREIVSQRERRIVR